MKTATISVSNSTNNMQQKLQHEQRLLNKGNCSSDTWQRQKNKRKQEWVHHAPLLHQVLDHAAALSTATLSILETVLMSAFAAATA